jgi:hypothetical protein
MPETRITPLTFVRRERILPARGEVLVRLGDLVGPADVVACCQVPGSVEVVDISRELGLPGDRATRCVRKAVGDVVQPNEVLASHRSLLAPLGPSSTARAGGRIMAVQSGLVLIESAPTTYLLRAHIAGRVASVMPGLGVVIATNAALIQGMWGCGGEAEGVLRVLADEPAKPLRAGSIDLSCRDTIVVGGSGFDEEALYQAVQAGVRGIIAGSLNSDLIPAVIKLPFPVVVTEGFGSCPMSEMAFSLLQANAGREAMLDAGTQPGRGARRPELLIPAQSGDARPAEPLAEPDAMPELRPGMRVRALRAPYLGRIGTVAGLPARALRLESGVRLPVAEVRFDAGQPVLIPLANLELVQ